MLQKIPHGLNYLYNIRPSQKKEVLQSVSETISLYLQSSGLLIKVTMYVFVLSVLLRYKK